MRDLVRTFGAYARIRNLERSSLVSVVTARTGDGSYIYEAYTHTHTRSHSVLWRDMSVVGKHGMGAVFVCWRICKCFFVKWGAPITNRDLEKSNV